MALQTSDERAGCKSVLVNIKRSKWIAEWWRSSRHHAINPSKRPQMLVSGPNTPSTRLKPPAWGPTEAVKGWAPPRKRESARNCEYNIFNCIIIETFLCRSFCLFLLYYCWDISKVFFLVFLSVIIRSGLIMILRLYCQDFSYTNNSFLALICFLFAHKQSFESNML